MKILADENIDYPVILGLRAYGYDVEMIYESMRGASDEKVLNESVSENTILLTEDKDFGEHVFRIGSEFAGVILVRLPWNGIPEKLKAILECIKTHGENLNNAFTVITPGRVRIRKR